MPKKWAPPTNDDGTLVNEAETIVRAVRGRFIHDVNALTQEVVGKSGRPFMTVPLSKAERLERFKEYRELDDPELWKKQLESVQNNPAALKRLLKSWAEGEAEWRNLKDQQDTANIPGATLDTLAPPMAPPAPLVSPETPLSVPTPMPITEPI